MFLSFNPQIQQKTYNEYTTTNQTITIGEMQGCKLVLPLTTMNSSIAMVGNIANYLYCCVCIHYSKEGWCIPKYLGQQSTCTRCPRRWYLCFKFGLLNVSIQPIHFLVRILSLSKNHSLPLNWSQIGYTGQIFCWASLHLQMARIFSVAEQRNKRINVHNIWALTSKDDIPCMNVTCDRQTRWRANN